VEQTPYDVALLDLKMPGMDGLELYRRIRELRADTVAIIVTAYAASDTAQSAHRAGAWQILSKPVDFTRLLNYIEQAAEQPLLMVVDDDTDLCNSLWDLFRDHSFRVGIAHSAEEAERQLRNKEYKVVLIDMKLPGKDGGEVYKLIRERSPAAHTVLITGFRGETDRAVEQILNDGADAVCYKPFNVPQLLETVKQLAS
jgi:DNA-binding NtrC family response regulator